MTVDDERLVVAIETNNFESLGRALAVARTAIGELPETPFTAAGFNVRLRGDDSNAVADKLNSVIASEIDAQLANRGFIVSRSSMSRVINCDPGTVALSIARQLPQEFGINFNFHHNSTQKEELIGWLNKPTQDIQHIVEQALSDVLGLPEIQML